MNIDTDITLSILKLTKNGSFTHETLKNDLHLPANVLSNSLRTLQKQGFINVTDHKIQATDMQRFELAIRALKNDADIEKVTALLQWREFEAMAGLAFEHNGYSVIKNLHFKNNGRRYEIDIVGWKNTSVVCVDCKHWHHAIGKSTLDNVVKKQVERVHALSRALPNPKIKIETSTLNSLTFVPVVLSLITEKSKFCHRVPIVSILQLQDFLNQLPAYHESILHISTAKHNKPRYSQSKLV